MSPLLVMDDVCIVGAGLAVPPWCSFKNESSLAPKEKEDKKKLDVAVKKKEKKKEWRYSLLPL